MTPVRVLLVDDDVQVRAALRRILTSDARVEVVAEAGDGRAAVELAAGYRPDVVVLDVRMPGTDGLTAAEEVLRLVPGTAVVLLTTFADDDYLARAVDLGVSGFLLKSGDPLELVAGVLAAAAGGSCLSPAVTRTVLAALRDTRRGAVRPELARLAPREREVLVLLAGGLTNAEIGTQLHLVEGTVKGYLRQVFTVLGVRNRVEAAMVAHEAGLLRDPTDLG